MNLKSSAPLLIFLLSVISGAGFLLFSALTSKPAAPLKVAVVRAEVEVIPRQFGLSLDSFNVTTETVKRNEFLSNILQRHHINLPEISVLSGKAKKVFDVRKIAAGNPYTVFTPKENSGNDSLSRAAYFVYQPNPIDYVVYDLRDSLRVYSGKHKVTTKMQTVSGVISSSLSQAFENAKGDPLLSMQLAEIYSYAINFYSLKKDDWFKMQYEQSYVQGTEGEKAVGSGRITSAVFSHAGKEYHSFYFQPDSLSKGEYYDENGKSLRTAFLKAPLKFDSRITSHYTHRRFHPVQKRWKAHLGTDFAAPSGTPIITTGKGVVIEAGYSSYNGNYVKIRHNGTYTTQYLHMSKRAVRRGQHVNQGQVIGYVGSTGLATGPHVCYRFWKNGRQVDAQKEYFPPAEPVTAHLRPAFDKMVASARQVLANISLEMEAAPGTEEELAMQVNQP